MVLSDCTYRSMKLIFRNRPPENSEEPRTPAWETFTIVRTALSTKCPSYSKTSDQTVIQATEKTKSFPRWSIYICTLVYTNEHADLQIEKKKYSLSILVRWNHQSIFFFKWHQMIVWNGVSWKIKMIKNLKLCNRMQTKL